MIDLKAGSSLPSQTSEALAQSQDIRRTTAESLFHSLEWTDEVTGYCDCPGKARHTKESGKRDCRVMIDGIPTVYCVHQSCAEEVKEVNRALRDGVKFLPEVVPTPEQKKAAATAKAKARQDDALKVRASRALAGILKTSSWPYDQIVQNSPIQIDAEDRIGMFRTFMEMFRDEEVIWIGNVNDTGKPEHGAHFKTRDQWLENLVPVGPFSCPSWFESGSFSRSKENVLIQRYLVVESDSLKKDEVGAIFRWLDQSVELPLRAVVDTAEKSLHGWFEFPPPDVLAELKVMLPVMGCDPKMFGPSQPCRLPGGLREGRIQRLIFARKGGVQ